MTPIRVIALDLDGTLALEDHTISPATRSALTELSREGVEIIIATGRRYRTTRYVIDNLGLDIFAVCNGGALGKKPDATTFHQTAFPRENLSEIVEVSRALNMSLVGQRDSHARGGADFIIDDGAPWSMPIQRYFDDNKMWSGAASLDDYDDEFLVLGGFDHASKLETLAAEVHRRFPNQYNTIIVPHPTSEYFYCEITQQHVHKWHGLTKLAELLNIEASSICAVGDELNDLSMIKGAGHGFAMGNGNPELQRYADHVCGNHDEDGLLEVIDYIRKHNTLMGPDQAKGTV